MKLTDARVKSLSEPGEYRDPSLEGFGVRVYESGKKAFFVRYQVGKRRRRRVLGRYPRLRLKTAREAAQRELDRVRGYVTEPADLDFDAFADQYLEYAKRQKSTWKEDARILEHDIRPAFAGMKAARVQRADVRELVHEVAERAPIMANHVRGLVQRIYNWGLEFDLVEHNPCHGVRPPAKVRPGQRVLSDDQLGELLRECRRRKASTGAALFQFLAYTGQRPGEALELERSHISGEWWDLARTKNGRPHRVYLAPEVIDLLGKRPQVGKLFDLVSYNQTRYRIEKKIGFKFTCHDLRRTFITGLISLGVNRDVVAACANHEIPGVTRRHYDRYEYQPEKEAAWRLWAQHCHALLS